MQANAHKVGKQQHDEDGWDESKFQFGLFVVPTWKYNIHLNKKNYDGVSLLIAQ